MANKKKDWVDRLRTRSFTHILRCLCHWDANYKQQLGKLRLGHEIFLTPNSVLPGSTQMKDWWARFEDFDIDKSRWTKYRNGTSCIEKPTQVEICRVIANKVNTEISGDLINFYNNGPNNSPLWTSLRKNEKNIITAWSKHLDILRLRRTELPSSIISRFSMDINEKPFSHGFANRGQKAAYYDTCWRLAASVASERMNWKNLIESSSHISLKNITIRHCDVAKFGLNLEEIEDLLNEELEDDRLVYLKNVRSNHGVDYPPQLPSPTLPNTLHIYKRQYISQPEECVAIEFYGGNIEERKNYLSKIEKWAPLPIDCDPYVNLPLDDSIDNDEIQ